MIKFNPGTIIYYPVSQHMWLITDSIDSYVRLYDMQPLNKVTMQRYKKKNYSFSYDSIVITEYIIL